MGIFRKKEEKTKVIIGINYNTTPISLLSALRVGVLLIYLVAWANMLTAMFEYIMGYISLFILLYAGLDLKRKDERFGNWIYLVTIGTLGSGMLLLSVHPVLFLIGAYLTPFFGNLLAIWFLKKDMEGNEQIREVMTVGYYETESEEA